MQALAPVKANEREIFMDVLRGFAILGIFIANLNGFSWYREIPRSEAGPYLLPEADRVMSFLHHLFIEGKFYYCKKKIILYAVAGCPAFADLAG